MVKRRCQKQYLTGFTPCKSERYLTGFTLIELIITMSIIAMMALIAVPAFTKYEENATFNSKVDEIVSDINQIVVSAQNPDQSTEMYLIGTDTVERKIIIRRLDFATPDNLRSASIEKEISMPSVVQSISYGSSPINTLQFEKGKNYFCALDKEELDNIQSIIIGNCLANNATANIDYIRLVSTNNISKTISVQSNPIRVTVRTGG